MNARFPNVVCVDTRLAVSAAVASKSVVESWHVAGEVTGGLDMKLKHAEITSTVALRMKEVTQVLFS